MNAQEIFDTVAVHLIKQGKPAVAHSGQACAYKTADGLRCAVGVLISDEEYEDKMEGKSVYTLLGNHKEKLARLIEHENLLATLQNNHDTRYDPGDAVISHQFTVGFPSVEVLIKRLRKTAALYGLTDSRIDLLLQTGE